MNAVLEGDEMNHRYRNCLGRVEQVYRQFLVDCEEVGSLDYNVRDVIWMHACIANTDESCFVFVNE